MTSAAELCADCNQSFPQWASVNRGVLLCDDCSSIHRQLGRHVSQIKHLQRSRWRPSQLDMIHYLVAAGANRYWEHVLYEPILSGKRSAQSSTAAKHTPLATKKPKPTDPLHPVKAEFIREKYLFLGFFKRPRNVNQDDLNQQLHASVRTGVLETSLYLLALGANPNFVHPTKGTAPMHVACQYNQLGQVEVLLAYGADVCIRDSWGQTPIDVALERASSSTEQAVLNSGPLSLSPEQNNLRLAWSPLVDTLVNAYYEVTDSLAYFLCRSVPDHKLAVVGTPSSPRVPVRTDSLKRVRTKGQSGLLNGHFLISTSILQNGAANGHDVQPDPNADDWMGKARYRLQQLPNLAFEDLCIDVYDEAERRLTNSFLETLESPLPSGQKPNGLPLNGPFDQAHRTTPSNNQSLTLYFLPPNTAYSSVRNQARQKLGRLSTVEFHTLVLDVLTEVSVRLLPLFPPTRLDLSTDVLPTQHHPYTSYFPSEVVDKGLHTSVSARLTPLPSPPLVDHGSEEHRPSYESTTEPTTPITNISSSASTCEPDHKLDLNNSDRRAVDAPRKLPGRSEGKIRTGRGDDPVYDQVAAESDINSLSTNGLSTVPCSPIVPSSSVTSNLKQPDLPLENMEASEDMDSSGHSNSSTSKPSSSAQTSNSNNLPLPATADQSIISCPGPIPGSRRLHLSHTGRVSHHRASVPSARANAMQSSRDFPLSPVLEAVNLAISHPEAKADRKESPSSPSGHQPEPCCVAARNEVDRLRKENSELRSQLHDFQTNSKSLEARLKILEDRMEQADMLIASLKKDKSTLQAALSANTTHHQPNAEDEQPSVGRTSPLNSADNEKPTVKALDEQKRSYSEKTSESGNYSVGSQCLDSGMMLRQGIVLRSSRGGSPVTSQSDKSASSSPTPHSVLARQAEVPSGRLSEATSAPVIVTKSVTSYVNLPRLMPKPVIVNASASKPPSNAAITTPSNSHAAVSLMGLPGDYVAPNATGSPSPAPLPASSATPSPSHSDSNRSGSDRSNLPGHSNLPTTRQLLQTQHAQILASIATLPDYDTPNEVADAEPYCRQVPSTTTATAKIIIPAASIHGAPVESVTNWQRPSSDQVVRCVEAIIVRIRNLVQLANGDRIGDFITCSLSIESAVHDILHLFPSFQHCPPNVSSALSELASASRSLQPHCEQMSSAPHRQQSRPIRGPDVHAVIRHAHRIAKAAKELLSIFQRTN